MTTFSSLRALSSATDGSVSQAGPVGGHGSPSPCAEAHGGEKANPATPEERKLTTKLATIRVLNDVMSMNQVFASIGTGVPYYEASLLGLLVRIPNSQSPVGL